MILSKELIVDIQTVYDISDEMEYTSLLEESIDLREKITENRFYLVVVGLFKRGKSSLINALLGKDMAPVDVTPLTSVITFFEYGVKEYAEVFFNDGEKLKTEINEITEYVSEEKNPKNSKNVKYIRMLCNNDLLKDITLIDTPGIGSIFDHNTDTTLDFTPRIDFALFVLSADIPLSKQDAEFIDLIRDHVPGIMFVLNKADLLSTNELQKMTDYNHNMLKDIFKTENMPMLINVSVKEYFENPNKGNIALLKEEINNNIGNNRAEILRMKIEKRIYSVLEQLNTYLKVKYDSMLMPVNELEEKKRSLEESIDYLMSGKVDFDAIVNNRIDELQKKVELQAEKKRNELLEYCDKIFVKDKDATWEEIKQTDSSEFNNKICKTIINSFEELKQNIEVSVKDEFAQIIKQYSTESKSYLYEIVEKMREILGIDIEKIIQSFDLEVYTAFYMKSDIKYLVPSIKSKLLYKLMPESIVKNMILKQIHANCHDLINPNPGRIRADVAYRIQESYRKFKYHFDKKLYDLLESLKSILEKSIDSKYSIEEDIDNQLKEIINKKKIVDQITSKYSLSVKNNSKSNIFQLNNT